jgi:hypothetical protein
VRATFLAVLALAAPAFPLSQEASTAAPRPVDFVRDILPLLKDQCWSCHGEKKVKGQLRLDARALALRGGVSGKVLVPGNAKESRLYQLLLDPNPDERMPQKAPALPKEQIDLVRAWIDQGAAWPDSASNAEAKLEKHWAYVKPVRHDPPAVRNAWWVRNPVDAFIAETLEEKGLKPRPEAPRHVLLRRLTLDLVGLPPSARELEDFLADASPNAWEKAVDRLLEDPRHGERWGRHWMDVWRYSDWYGYGGEIRNSMRHIWRWRDWIVESLNADKGYDRMVLEMLAGDELSPDDPDTVRATGFLARNWYKFNRNTWLESTIEHTSKAFIATTMNCARCHNHFFDPISQQEYYQWRAFFEPHHVRTDHAPGQSDLMKDGVARVFDAEPAAPTHLFVRGNDKDPDKSRAIAPGVPRAIGGSPLRIEPVRLPAAAVAPERRDFVRRDLLESGARELAQARAKVDPALQQIAKLEGALAQESPPAELDKTRAALQAALEELPLSLLAIPIAEARQAALEAVVAAERLEDAGKKESGEWKKAAEAALAAQRRHQALEARRVLLTAQRALVKARAAADPKKREADVAAGKKKVEEAEKALAKADADEKAAPSTAYAPRKTAVHPAQSTGRRLALARWIADPENPLTARVAVNHVWARHFGKPIVPTVFDFGSHGRPPSHPKLLDWLASEFVRGGWSMKKLHRLLVTSSAYRMDSTPDPAALAADPDNRLLWRMNPRRMEAELVRDSVLSIAGQLDPARGGPEIAHAEALSVPRRSLYFQHASDRQSEFLLLFDAANISECYERTESIVPQQALALANSALVQEKSRLLAGTLSKREADPSAFVAAAFAEVLGRAPTAVERSECQKFLAEQAALLSDPKKLTLFGGGGTLRVPPSPEPAQRAREDLVHVLFNHNDFVTIR